MLHEEDQFVHVVREPHVKSQNERDSTIRNQGNSQAVEAKNRGKVVLPDTRTKLEKSAATIVVVWNLWISKSSRTIGGSQSFFRNCLSQRNEIIRQIISQKTPECNYVCSFRSKDSGIKFWWIMCQKILTDRMSWQNFKRSFYSA